MSHPQGKKPLFQAQISAAQLGKDSGWELGEEGFGLRLQSFGHFYSYNLTPLTQSSQNSQKIRRYFSFLAEGENGPWRSTQWFDDTPLSLFMWSQMIFPLLCCSVCALSFIHNRVPVDTMVGFVSMAENARQWIDRLKGSCDVHIRMFRARNDEKRALLRVTSWQCHITWCIVLHLEWRRHLVFVRPFKGKPDHYKVITLITTGILFESDASQPHRYPGSFRVLAA